MKHRLSRIFFVTLLLLPLQLLAADASALLSMVTGQLGVTEEQASGGIGALLGSAQTSLGEEKYSSLLSMVPSLTGLATQGTSSSATSGLFGKASSMLGGGLDQTSKLLESFKALGLSPEMLGQFSQILLDYVQSKGGAEAMKLLQGGLPL